MIDASDVIGVLKSSTKEWTKQRKAEERGRRSRASREHVYSDRVNFTDVAHKILPDAYRHASGDGKYTVNQRNLYYACREKFRELTGRNLEYQYFSGNLLRKYINTHSDTAHWKITADPRGTLTIPNAKHAIRIPCGTLAIESHLAKARQSFDPMRLDFAIPVQWPSLAAGQRYHAVLYIEKEGFGPMLEDARIAERFDMAIISGKGQSTGAMRQFVDHVCYVGGGVPLYVVHDFDKHGFEIRNRLTTVSDTADEQGTVLYHFRNKIDVSDLGLRLADIEEYDLLKHSEQVECRGTSKCRCFQCQTIDRIEYDDVTDAEYEFLDGNERVEINALTAPQFIEWLESKLTAEGLGKRLIPDDRTVESAFRRAFAMARINDAIGEAREAAIKEAKAMKVPKALRRKLQAAMRDSDKPWDQVLYELAKETK
jgi:hypothetical protein